MVSVTSARLWPSTWLFTMAIFLCACLSTPCLGSGEVGVTSESGQSEPSYVQKLKEGIANTMDRAPPTFTRKLLEANVSVDCSLGLLKVMRGVRNLEPWALRLIDASAKYPTGVFQMSRADLGAFDECIETVLFDDYGEERSRGQYCNLQVYPGHKTDLDDLFSSAMQYTHPRIPKFRESIYELKLPLLRMGVCMLNDCNEGELQELIRAVLPPAINVTVSDCVTSRPPAFTKVQVAILSFLGVLALLIAVGTLLDVRRPAGKNVHRTKQNTLLSLLTLFSMASNTSMMLHVTKEKGSDAYRLRFLHGIRFFSIVWIVVGHCYGAPSDVWARTANLLKYADQWHSMILVAAFISVESFFFLSGFLLAMVASKQKRGGIVVFLFAVIRRFIRTLTPVFFIIMCLHLTPLIASGPNAMAYFKRLHDDFRSQWLVLLLQVQNYYFDINADIRMFPHLWYLSVDFQFFLVTLPILLLLRNRPKISVAIFALLSLVGCSVSVWQVAGTDMTPFVVVISESITTMVKTGYLYYFYPFYHAVCYFSGCITFFLVAWFKEKKIPKMFQLIAWLVAIASGLCCVFMKTVWYRTNDPTTELGKLSTTFFDRILWSIFLTWITLACATGRGGFLCTFLSWSAFTPLSRLAFGVYIVHLPFVQFALHMSRERLHYSHFFMVSFFFGVLVWSYLISYCLFIFCEAPTGRLDKLIFEPRRSSKEKQVKEDSVPNANVSEATVLPSLRDSKVEFLQCMNSKDALSGLHNDNGKPTSCHL